MHASIPLASWRPPLGLLAPLHLDPPGYLAPLLPKGVLHLACLLEGGGGPMVAPDYGLKLSGRDLTPETHKTP